MKKFFLSLLAVAGMLTACNMNEIESINRSADLINFTVTNGGMTKAVDVTTANLTAFEVTAFNHGTETSPYINAVSYTGGSGTFASATPYYWPEGNLDFYAWSQGAATGNQVVKTNYKTFVVTPSGTPASQVDLVFAGKTNIGKGSSVDGAIALNFRHAESKVVVKVKNTAPNLKFVISDWRLGFIDDAGTFTYSGQGVGYDGSTDGRIVDGESDANALNISMWSNNTDAAASKKYTNTLDANVNIAANASEALLGGEMIVIPQSVTAATAHASATEGSAVNGSYIGLKLKILNRDNDAVIYSDGASGTAWAIWPANFAFEPGKKYTFVVDLVGGGYYEENHDSNDDLDPILEGAVISFASVTVDDFSQQSNIDLPEIPVPVYTFGGLQIAPGNLMYNGSSFEISDSWNVCSYGEAKGLQENSTYFSFVEMGQLFEKADFSESDGDIDNVLDPFDGWRIPTMLEWEAIIGTTRAGSSVNGSAGKHYALVQIPDAFPNGGSYLNGLLIFPDNCTITGKALSGMDNNTSTYNMTVLEVEEYLSQGCALLAGFGYCSWDDFDGGWYSDGYYWSNSVHDGLNADYRVFGESQIDTYYKQKTDNYLNVRLVK